MERFEIRLNMFEYSRVLVELSFYETYIIAILLKFLILFVYL